MNSTRTLLLIAAWLVAQPAIAAYEVTGKMEASSCSGFVIRKCSFVQVTAIQGDDGNLYEVTRYFDKVDEFNESRGRCWIKTGGDWASLTSTLISRFKSPTFMTTGKTGDYEKIPSVDYVVFKCKQVR